MELQVRISLETAEIIEELKERYELEQKMRFTKSSVLMKAVNDTRSLWEKTAWQDVNIQLKKRAVAPNSVRPKFDVSVDVDNDLKYLKNYLPNYLGTRSVTIGVVIKYVLRLALSNIQMNDNESRTVSEMINQVKDKYLEIATTNESKDLLSKALDEIEYNFKNNSFS